MLRKTAVILTMLLCSLATQIYALGIGAISVDSALNQPLRVRIEILQLGATRLDELVIQIASPDEFQRFNIERVSFLLNVRFSIESDSRGDFVLLTSSQIMREPYLSFILETRWPNGRLLSEHTILLDLPVFDDQQTFASVRQSISPVLQAPDTATPRQPFVQPRPSDIIAPAPSTISPPVQSIEPISPPEQAQDQAPESLAEPEEVLLEQTVVEETPVEEAVAAVEESIVTDAVVAVTVVEDTLVAEEIVVEEEAPIAEETGVDEEPAEPAPQVAAAEEALAEEEAEPLAETNAEVVDASVEPVAEATEAETIESSATDTLSEIAQRVRPDDSVTLQQTMLALQQANPEAFDGGNINRLRSGEILRVPTLAEIKAIDPRLAVTEVNRQNQEIAQVDVQPLAAPATATPDQVAVPQGQLSVVSGDGDEIDTGAGSSESIQVENLELDQRIADLETQLAVQQEEADRARIEIEDLDSRLLELEAQIAATAEIIRLQDLQLAQLQESLAQAAQEAALREELAAAETAAPLSQPTSLLDDVLGILTGNTLLLGFLVVLVISILVALLLRRNKSARIEDEELEELEENEFESAAEQEEEPEDADSSDFDDELDEIIGDDQEPRDESQASPEYDVVSEAKRLIVAGQLDRAKSLLRTALKKNPGMDGLRWPLAELLSKQGDLSGFEQQAEILGVDSEAELKLQSLRDKLNSDDYGDDKFEEELEEELENEPEEELEPKQESEEEAEEGLDRDSSKDAKELAETASFLDDLGIDLDAFDDIEDYDSESSDGDSEEESSASGKGQDTEDSLDGVDIFETDDVPLTFDLGGDDAEVESSENEIEEKSEEERGVDFDAVDVEQAPEGASKDPGDLEIDSLEFEASAEETEPASDEDSAAEAELESYSFDADKQPAADEPAEESAESTAESTEDGLGFDFDKDEIKAEPETTEADAEIESVDFDQDDSTDTEVEKTVDKEAVAEEPIEAAQTEKEERNDAPGEDENIDLEADDGDDGDGGDDGADVEVVDDSEKEDEDEIDFDLDAADADGEMEHDSTDTSSGDDEIEFDIEDETEADDEIEISADAEVEPGDEIDELDNELDLGPLTDDEVEVDSVDDVEEVQLLPSDEVATKLELAYAYKKMGDAEGAREILLEVIKEGNEEQVTEAGKLLLTLETSSE